jgi:hypothetical protein
MKKVKLEVIKPWITKKITELLGFEDEVLIGYIFSLLEAKVFHLVLFSHFISFQLDKLFVKTRDKECIHSKDEF